MGRFAPILPELILSIGGTILMMVAAFTHRRSSLVNWLAIALLIAASLALIGAPSHAGRCSTESSARTCSPASAR